MRPVKIRTVSIDPAVIEVQTETEHAAVEIWDYFLSISSIENNMYKKEDDSIEIIYKDGSTRDIAKASDMLNISLLSRKVKKYYICYLRSENDGH